MFIQYFLKTQEATQEELHAAPEPKVTVFRLMSRAHISSKQIKCAVFMSSLLLLNFSQMK